MLMRFDGMWIVELKEICHILGGVVSLHSAEK